MQRIALVVGEVIVGMMVLADAILAVLEINVAVVEVVSGLVVVSLW